MRWDRALPDRLVRRLWDDPRALLSGGKLLHEKLRCSVVHLDLSEGSFVLKHHRPPRWRRRVGRMLSRTAAEKSWRYGNLLAAAGIATPQPRALVQGRLGPLPGDSFLLADYVPGTTLYRLLRHDSPGIQLLGGLARQMADVWQRLDRLRLAHCDLKPENLLVDPQGRLWLIDLDNIRRYRRRDRFRHRQARDLGDFFHPRSWRTNPAAARLFRDEISKASEANSTIPECPRDDTSQRITVLIGLRNGNDTLAACLDSIRDIADEVLVVDAGRRDRPMDITPHISGCRTVRAADGEASAALLNRACRQARHPWILHLESNERVNPELARQIQDAIASDPPVAGFQIARAIRLGASGQPPEFRPGTASLRLFRKSAGRYEPPAAGPQFVLRNECTLTLASRLIVDADSQARAA